MSNTEIKPDFCAENFAPIPLKLYRIFPIYFHMKWLCKIRHNFKYYDQIVNLEVGHLTVPHRQCQRCGLKETLSKSFQMEFDSIWMPVVLTKDELRDKKLSDLGI